MAFACSISTEDREFAEELLSGKHREEIKEFLGNDEEEVLLALTAIVGVFASNHAEREDVYTDRAFMPYFRSILTRHIDEDNFDSMNELYDTIKDANILKFDKDTPEDDARIEIIKAANGLYLEVKDEEGFTFAILRKPVLEDPQTKALRALRNMKDTLVELQDYGKGWKYINKNVNIPKTVGVGKDANPRVDTSKIPKISLALGNVLDEVVRNFFDETSLLWKFANNPEDMTEEEIDELLDTYRNNLSLNAIRGLVNDLLEVKRQIEQKFPGCVIISDEIDLFGQKQEDNSWVHGSADLLVVGKDGQIHVIDVKSSKATDKYVLDEEYVMRAELRESYGRQVTRYIKLLQSYGLNVDSVPRLCVIDTYYDLYDAENNTQGLEFHITEDKVEGSWKQKKVQAISVIVRDDEGNEIGRMPLSEFESNKEANPEGNPMHKEVGRSDKGKYIAPAFHRKSASEDIIDAIIEVDWDDLVKDYKKQFDAMTDEEAVLFLEFAGDPTKKQETHMRTSRARVNKPKEGLYNHSELLSETEISDVANHVAYRASEIVDELSKGIAHPELTDTDFSGRSHEYIINRIGINRILNYVADTIFKYDPEFSQEFDEGEYDTEEEWRSDFIFNQKKNILSQYREQLFLAGFSKLKKLEPSATLVPSTGTVARNAEAAEETADVGDNNTIEALEDNKNDGLTDVEAWMLGERHYSPKASLAEELKRLFESLVVYREDGRPETDKYGYGFRIHVDSTMAIETLLGWLQYCEKYEEMREILNTHASSNSWVRAIIQALDSDPSNNHNLRKKFFRHFRKDATKYSVCRSKYVDGKRVVITEVINTRSSYDVMRRSIYADFNHFNIPLYEDAEGGGRYISADKVSESLRKTSEIAKILNEIYKDYKDGSLKTDEDRNIVIQRMIDTKIAEKLSEVLTDIGIYGATPEIVANTIAQKINSRKGCAANRMRELAVSILKTMGSKDVRNIVGLNPLSEESNKRGVFKVYNNLLKMISDAVQEHVESSVYNDGKTYYSYNNPSYLGHIIRNLKNSAGDIVKFRQFMQDNFLKYEGWFKDHDGTILNHWLKLLDNEEELKWRDILDYKTQLSYDKTQYKELGGLGYMLSIIHEFFGQKGEDPKDSAWYAVPTMSNKPVSEFIRFKRYMQGTEQTMIKEVFVPTFKQELNRIIDVLEHWARGSEVNTMHYDLTDKNLLKVLDDAKDLEEIRGRVLRGELTVDDLRQITKAKSGAKFHFLNYLNSEFDNDTEFAKETTAKLNSMLQGPETDEYIIRTRLVENTIYKHMQQVVENELAFMRKLGLFEKQTIQTRAGENIEVLKYQRQFQNNELGTTEEEMEKALKNFIWNDIAANINIIQLTGTDLAYYGDSVNYQKRIAQIHSPGLWLYNDKDDDDGLSDGNLRSIHVSDEIVDGKNGVISEVFANAAIVLERFIESVPDSQKEEAKMMAKAIIASFDSFKITDGQSYSCPTSLRKKLSLMGEWEDEMEDAYDRIKKGDFDINDLGIVWQPTKPFLTAQVTKYSGTHGMTVRKTPLQDKNSEYVIMLAEALSAGGKMHSKLTEIYHFMEDTHFGDGKGTTGKIGERSANYNKRGIDTVHFESVSKVGVSGVIDIRGNLPFGEVYKRLHDKVHRESELTERQKELGLDPYYDDAYVDTYPIERYIEQQKAPIHLTDEHRQLYGSQIRILGISDISDNAEGFGKDGLTKQELVQEYKELHAQNIRDSFEELMDDLGLNDEKISDEEKRVRLSKILQEELSKDGKYGYDVKRACQLERNEKTGQLDFVIPLLDPIQSIRIQQLINSIIKKRINKQRIYGGSVVQTTVYDKDLKIVFKDAAGNKLLTWEQWKAKNGNNIEGFKQYLRDNQASIMHYECYMPMHPLLEKYAINADGSMMSYEELFDTEDEEGNIKRGIIPTEIQKNFLEMVGYRIPTEDKYSMVPIKVVGFLPKAAGQVIMMPKEITMLTGSDFDFDKMYVMMKSMNIKDIFKEQRGKYMEVDGKKGPRVEDAIMAQKYIKEHPGTAYTVSEIIELLENRREGRLDPSNKNASNFMKWYNHYMLKNVFELYNDMESEDRHIARESRNNRLIDLQWAVLTHPDTAIKMLNPGNFDPQRKTGRIITILRAQQRGEIDTEYTYEELSDLYDEEGVKALDSILRDQDEHSVTLPSNKIYFQQQNMQGTQMVGIFANHNVSHAFVSFQKIGIDLGDNAFYFCGRQIGSKSNMMQLDAMTGFNGKLISKTIAEFLAASVDTAKDPTLKDMNINTFTGTVAMALARLGYDTATIGMFLSQPIIIELSDYFFKKKNENSFYSGDTAIKEVWINTFNRRSDELEDVSILGEGSLTFDVLVDSLGDAKDADSQIKVLVAFKHLFTLANDINELTFCTKFNSVSNACGPTIADTQLEEMRVRNFENKVTSGKSCFYVPTAESSEWSDPQSVIDNDPILRAYYNYTVNSYTEDGGVEGASYRIFNEYFAHYFPGFQSIRDDFAENYTKSGRISAKTYNKLLNDYIFYLLTLEVKNEKGETMFKPVIPSDKKDLAYIVDNIVNTFKEVRDIKDRKPNILLDEGLGNNCLNIRLADNYLAADTLVFYGGQLDADKQDEVKAAWADLITSDNPKIREFGIMLFYYSLQKNGFIFSPRTLMTLASVTVRQEAVFSDDIGEKDRFQYYLEGLRELRDRDAYQVSIGSNNSIVTGDFLDQFVRNHANDYNIVPNIVMDDTMAWDDESIQVTLDINGSSFIQGPTMINSDKPCPYILVPREYGIGKNAKVITGIYKLRSFGSKGSIIKANGKATMYYDPISKLGLTNNYIEYNANFPIETSYFEDLRNISEAGEESELGDNTTGDSEKSPELNYRTDESNVTTAQIDKHVLQTFFKGMNDPETRKLRMSVAKSVSSMVNDAATVTDLRTKVENAVRKALDKVEGITDEQFEDLVTKIEEYCKKELNLC